MRIFSKEATIAKKKVHEKLKKHSQKLLRKTQFFFFPSLSFPIYPKMWLLDKLYIQLGFQ